MKKQKKEEVIEELTSSLQRLQADFENYKKHIEKERQRYIEYGKCELMTELLSVLDTFDNALQTSKDEGVTLVYDQLMKILKKHGLSVMEVTGKELDPNKHEVVLRVPDTNDDIVLEELQKGYECKERVLRCAKVKVGNADDN